MTEDEQNRRILELAERCNQLEENMRRLETVIPEMERHFQSKMRIMLMGIGESLYQAAAMSPVRGGVISVEYRVVGETEPANENTLVMRRNGGDVLLLAANGPTESNDPMELKLLSDRNKQGIEGVTNDALLATLDDHKTDVLVVNVYQLREK